MFDSISSGFAELKLKTGLEKPALISSISILIMNKNDNLFYNPHSGIDIIITIKLALQGRG